MRKPIWGDEVRKSLRLGDYTAKVATSCSKGSERDAAIVGNAATKCLNGELAGRNFWLLKYGVKRSYTLSRAWPAKRNSKAKCCPAGAQCYGCNSA